MSDIEAKLKKALERLETTAQQIVKTRGYNQDARAIKLLEELIREQLIHGKKEEVRQRRREEICNEARRNNRFKMPVMVCHKSVFFSVILKEECIMTTIDEYCRSYMGVWLDFRVGHVANFAKVYFQTQFDLDFTYICSKIE